MSTNTKAVAWNFSEICYGREIITFKYYTLIKSQLTYNAEEGMKIWSEMFHLKSAEILNTEFCLCLE